ncbi:MAG: hypothetical protein HQ527_01855 [Cyanobacteria bacterium]|nr:hypothetical protein [Cyanobacteria bacterium bin.51]
MKERRSAGELNDSAGDAELVRQAAEAFASSTGLQLKVHEQKGGNAGASPWTVGVLAAELNTVSCYHALVRRIDRREALGAVKAQFSQQEGKGLLVTEHLSAALAQHCRRIDLPFLDCSGNGYLRHGGLLMFICGERRSKEQGNKGSRPTGRAATATGLKLVFALLCRPELLSANSPQIAEAAGIAQGSAAAGLQDLEHRGHLVNLGWGKGWSLRSRRRLLEEWLQEFPVRLRPKLRSYRFRLADDQWWEKADPEAYGGQWGSEVAAALIGKLLRPEKVLLYLQPGSMRTGLSRLGKEQALKRDPDGDLELVEAFWSNEALGLNGPCVPEPLVIADLLASLDPRNLEAAAELKKRWDGGIED